ncbi:MAG: class I SAM-dependent methyltransferase [Deltaproteobacteria bacterium]|jgi:ubiquinone/menaquinone biosynthesis C-methylase UbiE|nr:class I SAM-dependent methyltransferase [Deltaproteobacteria bacterium]
MKNLRNEFFHRLLIDRGVKKGLRVLDVGCGLGDISIMAAELVGEAGEVVGFDISPEALAAAKKAVEEKCLSKVTFIQADIMELPKNLGVFDLIVGRRVLMYQNNAAQSIGHLLPFLSENGKMIFQESDGIAASFSSPMLPLHAKALNWIWSVVTKEGGNTHIGRQLYQEMKNAGLRISILRAEAILHTCESGSDLGWVAKMMAPRMFKHKVVRAEELEVETLELRLQEELQKSNIPFIRDMAFGICAEAGNGQDKQ